MLPMKNNNLQKKVFVILCLMFGVSTFSNSQELIFHSGFESGSAGLPADAHTDITGIDNSVSAPNDWVNDFESHPKIGSYKIYYQSFGTATDRYAKIVTDPANANNKVLQYWLKNPDVSSNVGRIQSDIYGNTNLTEVYYRFRMYIHSDMQKLESYAVPLIGLHWQNFGTTMIGHLTHTHSGLPLV